MLQIALKAVDWSNPREATDAAALLAPSAAVPSASCKDLFCTRACRQLLEPDDALVLLAHLPKSATAARAPLIAVLERCADAELLCHLPLLVSLLANDLWNRVDEGTMDNSALAQFLIERACRSFELLSKLYWLLEAERNAREATYHHGSGYMAVLYRLLLRANTSESASAANASLSSISEITELPHSDAIELIKAHQLINALTMHDEACAACAKPPLEQAELAAALELSTAKVFARKFPGLSRPLLPRRSFILPSHMLRPGAHACALVRGLRFRRSRAYVCSAGAGGRALARTFAAERLRVRIDRLQKHAENVEPGDRRFSFSIERAHTHKAHAHTHTAHEPRAHLARLLLSPPAASLPSLRQRAAARTACRAGRGRCGVACTA
jgi:hypothetical protein